MTEYDWDFRNRLVAVRELDDQDNVVFEVNYTYDVFDRRMAKSVDADGAGSGAAVATYFVYDGEHILLEFDDGGDLTQRYLHGPVIDQILAAEDVTSLSSAGDVVWPLADNQGTIRDLIDSTGTVLNHLKYNAFGQITSESNSAVDFLFAYTGRERDGETGLYYYRARYYDPAVGRFVSEDPIGFAAGDVNVSRYVGNGPANFVDPSGLEPPRHDRIITPHRWPNARQRPMYGKQPSPSRYSEDDFGLPRKLGEWSPRDFFRGSYISPGDAAYGCGGLACMRLGIRANDPISMIFAKDAMAFGELPDALKYLDGCLNGKGLVVVAERDTAPFYPWNGPAFPPGYQVRAYEVNIQPARNYATLMGDAKSWYWEEASGPLRGREVISHNQNPRAAYTTYIVIPNAASTSPIPEALRDPNRRGLIGRIPD